MPPNWVTHLWLTNQKHNHLIFKKNYRLFQNHILCRAHLQTETQFHTTAKVQSMYVVAGQARPLRALRPFYGCQWRCSNYGYNVGWWLPDSLIQNKGIFEFGNPIHKLFGQSWGPLCTSECPPPPPSPSHSCGCAQTNVLVQKHESVGCLVGGWPPAAADIDKKNVLEVKGGVWSQGF